MRAILSLVLLLSPCLAFALPVGSFDIYGDSGLLNQFETHAEAEQHYYHCALNNEQLYNVFALASPVVCSQPQVSPFVDAVFQCRRFDSSRCDIVTGFSDGPGQRVWKISETRYKPVFLLESTYCELLPNRNADVEVYEETTGLRVAGAFRTCAHNENRFHYDVQYDGTNPLVVVLRRNDGITECVSVPSPRKRID